MAEDFLDSLVILDERDQPHLAITLRTERNHSSPAGWTSTMEIASMSAVIQADYIGVPVEGPYKPEHYRY